MVKIKSRLMNSCECAMTSHAFNEDLIIGVTQRFFFTHDVVKSKRSIFDYMNYT